MIDTYTKNHRIRFTFFKASVVELVDTTDSKSVAFGCGGSSPPTGTNIKKALTSVSAFFLYSIFYQRTALDPASPQEVRKINDHQNHAIRNQADPLPLESV